MYIELKMFDDPFKAFEYTFNNHFIYGIKGYDSNQWRVERYYNEKVDNFIKAHLPLLDGIYRSWAKQKGPSHKE
jgi:hypothetical protein